MTSLRNHRVVIASLFLPTTAVLGESAPGTPNIPQPEFPPRFPLVSDNLNLKSARPALGSHARQPSGSGLTLPIKSIVEDLKDKTRNPTPSTRSPTAEIANPFTKLTRFEDVVTERLVDNDQPDELSNATLSPPASRKQPSSSGAEPRLQRKHSRSASRHPPAKKGGQMWHFESNPHCNGGLNNAVESVGNKLKKKLWVGTLGTCTDGFGEAVRQDIDIRMITEQKSLPVWIPDAEFQSCYDEFCHQVLWPALHYAIPDAPKTKLFYESAAYKQYVSVNQRFADAIIANYQEGDIIWVNDYHLMLLPLLLRSSLQIPPSTPIGFFMHVAFPSSEIFRCLSVRRDLLSGLMAADLVGFQTPNYARHFRQTVSRILAFEALPKGIRIPEGDEGRLVKVDELVRVGGLREKAQKPNETPESQLAEEVVKAGEEDNMKALERERFVDVGSFPMGIDVKRLQERKQDPEVAEWVSVLKQRYAGMKIVVGRDKLDGVQGVRHKVQAFERFLERYKEFQGKVVLIQVALQTTESNEVAGGVSDVVARVNSRFSTLTYQPVVFLHVQDLTFSQYLALLTVADAFMVTSLREGMALRTHEFVECQEGKENPGGLILSEFAGSYSYSGFRSCIAINPWDTRGTADALYSALTMNSEDSKTRWMELHNHVTTQTAQAFVNSFLSRVIRAHSEHYLDDTEDVPPLDLTRVLPRYKHSQRRLILVDFEGTLWRRDLTRKGLQAYLNGEFKIPEEPLEVLKSLSEDKRNDVWLLSGLPVRDVLDRVAEKVPNIGIVAENGCFIKTKPGRNSLGTWINLVANLNLTWKSSCLEILNYFTERTPGSIIEEREASIIWRYWTGDPLADSADRQWARRQAAEAQNHIFDSLGERYGLRIIPGKSSFLVLPGNISRSTAVGAVLQPGGPASSSAAVRSHSRQFSASENYGAFNTPASPTITISASASRLDDTRGLANEIDFLLVISSDEPLLRRMNEIEGADAECVTVSTGKRGTDARWKLDLDEGETTVYSAPVDHDSEEVKETGKAGNVVVKVLERFVVVGNGSLKSPVL
ncbi:glycosyltransferase family 20 protein [Macrolepiota fuliginosa MF-IS2]|uniref:Glycosyltransferase family 20 protein n=1 Tax=Macrolepiota fuliginosa MF-IS2 TaxID=1400762 RepID=A0A9P5XDN4_9AGAR|nr:glycosyltransferase family 20 protein [Macrolepiota fuliginosa MF-IS2]